MYPKARSENLVVQEMDDETLVYDLKTHEAHCLNKTAAFVWNNCSGNRSIDEIARSVESKFGHPVDGDLVRLAIKQLEDKGLLKESGISGLAMPSRRELIKKIGIASAIAIPIVASLVAPVGVMAASCTCTTPGNCITQSSCPSTVNCNASHQCAP